MEERDMVLLLNEDGVEIDGLQQNVMSEFAQLINVADI
jgi:hypothetical protein